MDESFVSRRTRGLSEPIAIFHLTTMVVGLAILALGAYTINSSLVSCTISLSLCIIGCFITVVSFVAYFGTYMEHIGFLKTYSATIILFSSLEIIAFGIVYARRKELDAYGSALWDFFQAKDEQLLINIEESLHCCGYANPEDRPVLMSLVNHDPIITAAAGCKDVIIGSIFHWKNWIIVGVVVLVTIKLLALVSSILLIILIKKDTDEERSYLTVLSAQRDSSAWYHGNIGWGKNGTPSLSGHSPIFVRHPTTLHSSPSTSSGRSNYFYTPRSPQFCPQRVPRYGSTQSTFSFKSVNN
ncbi:hypothetical protein O0I10_010466 [Lichtheimia ornata]|uniref:Tetraspanin n=1 Tax=Lichtheimia ornata TaxID=688661 RepID=A0AAD7XRB6_9FUNG|nr:uncharacterized protein O0I10_010466 [Lichtheimia ornata]KAJ8653899.1 hypothetical protein O0I10_010466 [Lichtheimia ornata]